MPSGLIAVDNHGAALFLLPLMLNTALLQVGASDEHDASISGIWVEGR
jgi:hypothetical protein